MKSIKLLSFCLIFALLQIATISTASASPVGVSYTTFGTLAGATFGGSGIPNNAVAITTITDGGNTITLGLTATQRFANTAPTNNNAGVFTAQAGGDTLDSAPSYATWNFDYYASATGGSYSYDILYDFDPAADTDQSALGRVSFGPVGAGVSQDSWNLGMPFLTSGAFGAAPSYGSFNPNSAGQYSFALVVKKAGVEIGRSAIEVNATGVPEPSSLLLLGTGLIGMVALLAQKEKAANRVS